MKWLLLLFLDWSTPLMRFLLYFAITVGNDLSAGTVPTEIGSLTALTNLNLGKSEQTDDGRRPGGDFQGFVSYLASSYPKQIKI